MEVRVASPEYFRTIGIPLKRGRLFTSSDAMTASQAVLLSESAVKRYFANEDPLGRTIELGWHFDDNKQAGGVVVGIVGDVKDAGLDEPSPPEIYIPHAQIGVSDMTVVLRGGLPPSALSRSVEGVLRELDPDLPLSNARTLDDVRTASVSGRRFYVLLLSLFAAVALVLAAIGIFGVMSYAVAQQTREIGIRMALGATAANVRQLVVREGLRTTIVGLAIGTLMAAGIGKLVSGLLYRVSPFDPLVLTAAIVVLSTASLLACYLPARRATLIAPTDALRAE